MKIDKKLQDEFNELAALTGFISDFYNYSGIRDNMDMTEYDAHIWDIHKRLEADGLPPHPEVLAFHTLERNAGYKPQSVKEYKQFVDNLKFDIQQADKVLAFEFNKFGEEQMRAHCPKADDKALLSRAAIRHGCLHLLRLL